MSEHEIARGFTVVAELPKSDSDWRMVKFGDLIILANGEHPPRIIHPDGKIEVISSWLASGSRQHSILAVASPG